MASTGELPKSRVCCNSSEPPPYDTLPHGTPEKHLNRCLSSEDPSNSCTQTSYLAAVDLILRLPGDETNDRLVREALYGRSFAEIQRLTRFSRHLLHHCEADLTAKNTVEGVDTLHAPHSIIFTAALPKGDHAAKFSRGSSLEHSSTPKGGNCSVVKTDNKILATSAPPPVSDLAPKTQGADSKNNGPFDTVPNLRQDLAFHGAASVSSSTSGPITSAGKTYGEPRKKLVQSKHKENQHFEDEKDVVQKLLTHSTEEFIKDCYLRVQYQASSKNTNQTYKGCLNFLKSEAKNGSTQWSDGSQWASIVTEGLNASHNGSLRYAVTAVAFAKWHAGQTQLISDRSAQYAAQNVTSRILDQCAEEEEDRERRRKYLNTHLTRGRKWSLLVCELGPGILLQNIWALAKSSSSALDHLVTGLLFDSEKMTVLSLLGQQVHLLINTGRTSPKKFREDLEISALPDVPIMSKVSRDANGATWPIPDQVDSDQLLVRSTGHKLNTTAVEKLRGTTWVESDVILACLQLADKLPPVRVGFSIPIHQQKSPSKTMQRPFQRASNQIKKWNKGTSTANSLVCFFLLFQNERHFSLLEINQPDGCAYHYDSMCTGDNVDVKRTFVEEFPSFSYVEKSVLQQKDSHSCGPLVISNARYRMLGREVLDQSMDLCKAEILRSEAANLLHLAWENDALVRAPPSSRTKRRLEIETNQPSKRQKRKLPPRKSRTHQPPAFS